MARTRNDIARSGIRLAVRAGSRKPDISSVEAFKRALLDAKSIAYLKVGSGLYMDGLLKRLEIADAVTPKSRGRPPTSSASSPPKARSILASSSSADPNDAGRRPRRPSRRRYSPM